MRNNLLLRLLAALLINHLALGSESHRPEGVHNRGAHYAPTNTNGGRTSSSSSHTSWSGGHGHQHQNQALQEEPVSRASVQGDELILTSDSGSGCWDDEDCTTFPTEAGSGDDLITPRYLRVPRKTTPSPRFVSTVRSVNANKQCDGDDEDCVEGSGSDGDEDAQPSSANGNRFNSYVPSTGAPSWPGNRPLPMPPTTPGYGHHRPAQIPYQPYPPPQPPRPQPTPYTEEIDRSILFTSRPIPPALPVYPGGRQYPQPRASPPPRPTGRPVIVDVPKPFIPHQKQQEKEKPKLATTTHTTYNKSSADRTALIIGLIAVILIVIVIIAPIIVFIKVRYRTGSSCKALDASSRVKGTSNYSQFAAVSGNPAMMSVNGGSGSVTHLNGSTSMSGGGGGGGGDFKSQQQQQQQQSALQQQQQGAKLSKKKDPREWYV